MKHDSQVILNGGVNLQQGKDIRSRRGSPSRVNTGSGNVGPRKVERTLFPTENDTDDWRVCKQKVFAMQHVASSPRVADSILFGW